MPISLTAGQRIILREVFRQGFYEALAAQRRMKLANEFEVVAVKGVRVAEARMDAKEGTRPELLQAEILLKQVRLQQRQAAAVELYHQEILPRSEETLKLAEDGYKAGEFDFLQVLIARRTFFETNLEFVVAQVSLAKASVMLDGQVLSGGLDSTRDTEFDSGLRDQTLSGQ